MKGMKSKSFLFAIALLTLVLLPSCKAAPATTTTPASTPAWMEIELTDVRTGQKFRISDFKGKPVLLESFAVWCPTCLAQQREIAKLFLSEGDAVVHISLDTDPNEDAARVREHLEANGLNWWFAIAPIELTRALIDYFVFQVVNAPGAPVVLICADQSTRFLDRGVKSADKLLSEIDKGCQ